MSPLSPALRAVGAFGAGAATVGAFAPYSLFPLALLGPALLFWLWRGGTPQDAFREGWLFGLGLLGFGVSWMHISIAQFGGSGLVLAIAVTLLFVLVVALYYGLAGWLAARMSDGTGLPSLLLIYPALWVLLEWLRGWFLTGFPWLALGYSQIDAPLAGWAPLFGSYGVSLAVAFSATALVAAIGAGWTRRLWLGALLILLWGGGWLLSGHAWTRPAGEPLKVSLIQGNIAQKEKWQRDKLGESLSRYVNLTRQQWESDLIVWPETAVPAFYHRMDESMLTPLEQEARGQGAELLIGIPVWKREGNRFFNAMASLGGSEREFYFKRHLVPFGEFTPLKSLLQPVVDLLRIPMSDFTAGSEARPLLNLAGYPAGISICYEDAFGNEVIQALPDAAFLVNASNDAWFGDSLAPPQHLEIARMRSRETGRYMLRSTNTGISALIGPMGELIDTSPAFEQHVLSGELVPMQGSTPYARYGNVPLVLLALTMLAVGLVGSRVRAGKNMEPQMNANHRE
jgi:apolipoprotein N-acyltransferase